MQYNPGSSLGIIDDIDFICGTNSTSYPTADKTRNVNRHYNKAVIDYLKTDGRLQFDDPNNTGLPSSAFTLLDNQTQYALPTNLLKLWAIEIIDINGESTRLTPIDLDDLDRTISDYKNVKGIPKEYDIRGENVFIYPAADTTLVTGTNGGIMYFAREVDPFTASDTTQEPGLPEPFHRILSLGASYDWLVINDTAQKADRILGQYEQLRAELREFASTRSKDGDTRLIPQHNQADCI